MSVGRLKTSQKLARHRWKDHRRRLDTLEEVPPRRKQLLDSRPQLGCRGMPVGAGAGRGRLDRPLRAPPGQHNVSEQSAGTGRRRRPGNIPLRTP